MDSVLTSIADGVWTRRSAFCATNTTVVKGVGGVFVVDAGVHESEVVGLADDLAELGLDVVAGFSTHPHWDHLLWHPRLGVVPRLATARTAETARVRLAGGIDARRFGIPDDVSLDLLGDVTGLLEGATHVPWDGPAIRILEHQAHAPGHAALMIEERRVLLAGDMLSDVLVPLLDLNGTADPFGDYLTALEMFESVTDAVDAVVPGHGSIGGVSELRERITRDRAYVEALRDGREPDDPRVGPSAEPGWEWVSEVHTGQLQRLAQRNA